MGTQVDEVFARAKKAQFVGPTPGRLSVHLVGSGRGPVDAENRIEVGTVISIFSKEHVLVVLQEKKK